MKNHLNNPLKGIIQTLICFSILLAVSLGCALPNKFWRNYEQKSFSSKQWRDGDALERGTMVIDLYTKRIIEGKQKEQIAELLGEPDKKSASDGGELWQYELEFAGEEPTQYFSVTFDKNGRAAVGRKK